MQDLEEQEKPECTTHSKEHPQTVVLNHCFNMGNVCYRSYIFGAG